MTRLVHQNQAISSSKQFQGSRRGKISIVIFGVGLHFSLLYFPRAGLPLDSQFPLKSSKYRICLNPSSHLAGTAPPEESWWGQDGNSCFDFGPRRKQRIKRARNQQVTVQGEERRRRQLVKEEKLHCWVLPASVPSGQDLKHPSIIVRAPRAPEISRLALANPAGENRKIYCEYRTCPR